MSKSSILVIAVFLVAAAAVALVRLPADAFFSSDEGVKFIQLRSLAESSFRDARIVWPGDEFGLGRRYAVVERFFELRGGELYSPHPLLFALASAPGWVLFGFPGLYILPLLAGAATAALTIKLGRTFGVRRPWLAGAVVALASPLFFYSLCYWEHTAAVALWLGGFALLLKRSPARLVAAGALWGAGAALRPEFYWLAACSMAALFLFNKGRTGPDGGLAGRGLRRHGRRPGVVDAGRVGPTGVHAPGRQPRLRHPPRPDGVPVRRRPLADGRHAVAPGRGRGVRAAVRFNGAKMAARRIRRRRRRGAADSRVLAILRRLRDGARGLFSGGLRPRLPGSSRGAASVPRHPAAREIVLRGRRRLRGYAVRRRPGYQRLRLGAAVPAVRSSGGGRRTGPGGRGERGARPYPAGGLRNRVRGPVRGDGSSSAWRASRRRRASTATSSPTSAPARGRPF